MKLPNRENAYIPLSKLKNYLLSETHVVGRTKAKFLRGFGFDDKNIDFLEQALLSIAQNQEIDEVVSSPHGTKYVIDGSLKTPIGISVNMKTIWIVDKGQDRPRFVTAIPS